MKTEKKVIEEITYISNNGKCRSKYKSDIVNYEKNLIIHNNVQHFHIPNLPEDDNLDDFSDWYKFKSYEEFEAFNSIENIHSDIYIDVSINRDNSFMFKEEIINQWINLRLAYGGDDLGYCYSTIKYLNSPSSYWLGINFKKAYPIIVKELEKLENEI